MPASYFSDIEPIKFEGTESTNPLAFRYYDKDRVVMGKTMAEHLRMAVCYWHTFCWDGFDVFGAGTFNRPWHGGPIDQTRADHKLDEAFEFFTRLGLPYFCFHDVDVMVFVTKSGVLRADCNAFLTFQIHGVHDPDFRGNGLVGAECPRLFQELIHERCLAVVNVGDDCDVADVVHDAACGRSRLGERLQFPNGTP
jgi:hypothetical protein